MRSYLLILTVIFVFFHDISDAQDVVSVRKKDFKITEAGFKEAWTHIKLGDQYFVAGGIYFGTAFNEYFEASLYNAQSPELNYNLGITSLLSDKKDDASGYLLRAYELNNEITDDIHLSIGRALHYSGRYSEAVEELNKYLNSSSRKPKEGLALAKKQILECQSAIEVTKDTLRLGILNLGPTVNTSADEYSQVFTSDGKTMYFGSRKGLEKFNDYYKDSKFDENIFVSKLTAGVWSEAASAGPAITTAYCESPLYINKSGTVMYIYAGYENGGDIMMSEVRNGEWQNPKSINLKINTKKKETTFTVSPSGKEIYFVSEGGDDNLGGKDIYLITQKSEKGWNKPMNMGDAVNTVYDEEAVSLSVTGDTLFFSSNGHNTIGGFDIFFSVKNSSGTWGGARNYGYPLNTPYDELFYYPSVTGDSSFYFVSNRSNGYGGLDIYEGNILPPPEPEPVVIVPEVEKVVIPVIPAPAPLAEELVFFLNGKVTDSESGAPLQAKINAIDIKTNEVVASITSSAVDGTYSFRVPEKKSYLLELRAAGYLSDLKRVSVPAGYVPDRFSFNVAMSKVKVGKTVILNNILFESGKAVLTAGSYSELNRLLAFLQDNPGVKLEISGHTDITGSEPLNARLSNDRAKTVVMYLVSKGIAQARISYKGFGSSQPVSTNATPQGRANNRRVEFKILEI